MRWGNIKKKVLLIETVGVIGCNREKCEIQNFILSISQNALRIISMYVVEESFLIWG